MDLKRVLTINIFIIFIISIGAHFIYDLLPIDIFAIFFPVNESIYEHIKMIYTSFLISGISEYVMLKKFNIKYTNFFINLLLTSLISIVAFLIVWLPIYYRIGENMILTIIILFISICISQISAYYILSFKENKLLNYGSIFIIIVISITLAYFTYNPLYNDLFFDPMEEKYGINTYVLNNKKG